MSNELYIVWVVAQDQETASRRIGQIKDKLEAAGNDITVTLALEGGKLPLEIVDNTQKAAFQAKYKVDAIVTDSNIDTVYSEDLMFELNKELEKIEIKEIKKEKVTNE